MPADLAHEMRTPLATIDAHLEAIEDGVRHLDSDTVTVLRSSTQRLRRLAEDIGAVSHAEGNLIDNALRHTPGGGSVTVSCRRVDHWVEYAVADTGEGVAAEHLPHLFDRFYRVDTARDRHHGGSGIGLAIAKAHIEAHGGGVFATSVGPGHGSIFTVRLPSV